MLLSSASHIPVLHLMRACLLLMAWFRAAKSKFRLLCTDKSHLFNRQLCVGVKVRRGLGEPCFQLKRQKNSVGHVSYSQIIQKDGSTEVWKNEERKQWLTLRWKKCSLDTSYNNHCRPHVTTDPRLSQGVSNDHAPAACPRAGPPADSPRGGGCSYKASTRSAARTESVPSGHPEHTSPVTSCEWFLSLSSDIAISARRHLLLTGCFSYKPALFSFQWKRIES